MDRTVVQYFVPRTIIATCWFAFQKEAAVSSRKETPIGAVAVERSLPAKEKALSPRHPGRCTSRRLSGFQDTSARRLSCSGWYFRQERCASSRSGEFLAWPPSSLACFSMSSSTNHHRHRWPVRRSNANDRTTAKKNAPTQSSGVPGRLSTIRSSRAGHSATVRSAMAVLSGWPISSR